jgi:2-octaprenyl-6-methoxyphenol hydroxylase
MPELGHAPDEADIVIAGGGPVGATLAHALAPLAAMGQRILQVADAQAPDARDDRPISLSWGSRLLLDRLGLWEGLAATPIERIQVSQRGHFGRTLISAADHGVDALGYVVSYADLCSSLRPAPGITHLAGRLRQFERRDGRISCGISCDGISGGGTDSVPESGDAAQVSMQVSARLLVLADGGAQGYDHVKDYGQSAVVCTLRAERQESGTACERFTPGGPLALLPFRDQLALVWSSPTRDAEELMRLDDAAFLTQLRLAFGARLGGFHDAAPRRAFTLSLRYRNRVAAPGLAVIGNAAQSLHPVAAQGLNLGLRDARELADMLLEDGACPDTAQFARRYQARRRADRLAMTRITDGMIAAFSLPGPLAAAARGAALTLLDVLPPARRLLSRRMMFGARGFP